MAPSKHSDRSAAPAPSTPPDIVLVRPATRADTDALTRIARQVGIGHSQPAEVADDIDFSQALIAGQSPWHQGPLYLCSEAISAGTLERRGVVGQCKLEVMAAGVWKRQARKRRFIVGREPITADYEQLEYDAGPQHAMEFAANAVSKDHRGLGIGSMHIRSRLLLLRHLLRKLSHIETVCSVTLTQEDTSASTPDALVYPFYEHAVRAFFGGRAFDEVDRLRYKNRARDGSVQFVGEFLQSAGEHDPFRAIPCHLLPDHVRSALGSVRASAERTHAFFLKLGFKHHGRYDVLDGSQVLELPRDHFEAVCRVETFVARSDKNVPPYAPQRVFMVQPQQGKDFDISRFRCVRAPVVEDRGELHVRKEVLGLIDARDGTMLESLLPGDEGV